MLDPQRIIHLAEISAIDLQTTDPYKYKCQVQMALSEGETLLQRLKC